MIENHDEIVVYRVEDMKIDLNSNGLDPSKLSDSHIKNLYDRLNRAVEKSDLFDRINDVISEFVSEYQAEESEHIGESNREQDERDYNELRTREARTFTEDNL